MGQHVTLIGAGLVGSLLATLLAKRDLEVEVFERRADLRIGGGERGKSINLALSNRGIHALKQVGLAEEVLAHAIPMRGRYVHPKDGKENLQPYGNTEADCIYSISRGLLNAILMSAAEATGRVSIRFDRRVTHVDFETAEIQWKSDTTAEEGRAGFTRILGTDGASSALRTALEKRASLRSTEEFLGHGYKELILPARPGGGFALEKNALHIWPRETFMLIALPNEDGSFTCTLFLPWDGKASFAKLTTPASIFEFFKDHFPDVVPKLPNMVSDFQNNPTGKMVTVRTLPWHFEGKGLLLGDAAHAIVPFFGQGMNCGFEDVATLARLFDGQGVPLTETEWAKAFAVFQKERKTNADAIADMAIENFIEMRDKVANERFLLEKRVERLLHERFPNDYVNRYQLVTFTRVPYRVALEIGQRQKKILDELLAGVARPEAIDFQRAEALIEEELSPILGEWRSYLEETWPT